MANIRLRITRRLAISFIITGWCPSGIVFLEEIRSRMINEIGWL
jgi:hypothetical protein